MTAQELIQVVKSATVDELAQIRSLLRVPNTNEIYGRSSDVPRDLGSLWNRDKQSIVDTK